MPKNYTIVEITSTHKCNTRSSTKRFNHVTTFKNSPNMFKMDTSEKINAHIGKDYFDRIDPKNNHSVTNIESH